MRHCSPPPTLALACVAATLLAACASGTPPSMTNESPLPVTYPTTPRSGQVDTYHGVEVADPYRWLEDVDSAAVKGWVEAQNAVSMPWLERIPARVRIIERLRALWDYDQYGYPWLADKARVPVRKGGRYFYVEKRGLQDQGVLYWSTSPDAAPRVLIDPNLFSADATVSLGDFVVSPDGRLVAYALSDGGTDWKTWRVREVDSGRDLPDLLDRTKFTRPSWLPDSRSFYYARYPAKPDGGGDDQKQVRVYHHRLGAAQEDDALAYAITDHPRRNPEALVSDDGHWLVLTIFDGYEANAIYLQDLSRPGAPVVRLLDAWDGLYDFLGNDGEVLYFKTTQGAPRGRVVAIRASAPTVADWREVVPERAERLDSASLVGHHVVAAYLRDARSVVRVHRLDGSLRNELALPGLGTVYGFPDDIASGETFFAYTDYLAPLALYRYDLARDEVALFRKPAVAFDPAPYVTEQVFYPGRDGTRVPMFITRRRDLELNGTNAVLLYGYGGFDVSLTPGFSPGVAGWLELGGVFAVANLRGGGEYGEAWHEAGTRLAKQNVFDDFIAAGEWLVRERYTSPAKLAVMGGSNGGLLVGAVLVQRPDLFGAALPDVGVLDMMRYHTHCANAYQWSSDYGTVEDAAQFRALRAYSPVHNVKAGVCYPPTLVTTGDHDDRVVPWHSYKFAAALQHAQACDNPVLIRVETRAGHGAGKPTWMQVENLADKWAFLVRHLGM